MTIYVIQKSGFDITTRHPPLSDSIEGLRLILLARFLGWDYWIWGYEDLKDFEADDRGMEELGKCELWTLLVPKDEIKWCNLTLLREVQKPVWSWFSMDPELIRKSGDIPMAFIKAPIRPSWVSKKESARNPLLTAGLRDDD